MLKLLFCVMIIGMGNLGLAQHDKDLNSDTTRSIDPSRYLLNKKQFMDKYGIDDTSRALINFYFSKRNTAGSFLSIYTIFFTGQLYVIAIAATFPGEGLISTGVVILCIGYTLLVFVPATVFLIEGLQGLGKYSKKKLYIEVMNYLKGNGIPEKHMKKMMKNPLYWRNY